jgi:predicted  nucleic acid-binding Zn-ribbon protein
MEKSFRKQLDECQENIERLLKEMKDKEKEFEEYCRQVEIDSKYMSGVQLVGFEFLKDLNKN